MSVRAFGSSTTAHPTWASKTGYGLLNFIIPSTPNGYAYECTTPGTSGTDEPVWLTTPGQTILDGDEEQEDPVTWTCRQLASPNPLTVELDTGGFGGYPYKEIWVRSQRAEGQDEFIVYGSFDKSNWREIDSLEAPQTEAKDNRHKGLVSAYRHIRVVVDSESECDIEIVAGV